jgi:predicted AlkP superfamily phosphohydrolase/phosphomutase
MPASAKVLLIGLDAAEITCIHRWVAEGHLPNLGRLIETGEMTPLASAAAEFPDEVWPSIYTSANSAEIGKYFYIQPEVGTTTLKLMDDVPRHALRHGVLSAGFGRPGRGQAWALPAAQLR